MVLHNIANLGYSFGRIYYELGHDVTIGFLNDDDRKDVLKINPAIKQQIIGADPTYKLMLHIRRSTRNIDLLHCNYCLFPVIAGYWCKITGRKKYIAHAHGSDIRNIENKKYGFIIKHTIRKANLFLVSTPDLLKVGRMIRNDVTWIPNPVDTERFQPIKSQIDLHQGFDYAVFMPVTNPKMKGTESVVKQFSKLPPNFCLHLVRYKPSPHDYTLLKLIKKSNLKDRIFIHKRIPHTEIVQFYNASDIVIDQFGGFRAFGNVTLEALACGKVVITDYDGSDYPEKPPVTAISVNNLAQTLLNLRIKNNLAGREWILKYHSFPHIRSLLGKELERI